MSGPEIKIGIVGCALIAMKLSRSISLAPNATVYAVASRSLEKAKKFVKDTNLHPSVKTYGSYEALLDDPDVDAVYMPLPTSLHAKWALLAAQKKKHILLEKPVAFNVKELDAILEVVESNGLQFMDCTMWMHHPRTAKMKEFLSSSELFGELQYVQSFFPYTGTTGDPNFWENDIRVKPDLDGLGSLGDCGWYCVRAILWAADYELPKTVVALRGPVTNKYGVITSCGASLHWEDGRMATFHCSFNSNMAMDLIVAGTRGTLHLNDFAIPIIEKEALYDTSTLSWFNDEFTEWVGKPTIHTVTTDLAQDVLMVKEFARLVGRIKNNSEPEKKWHTYSRKTQLVIDAVKISIEKGCQEVEIAK